MFKYFSHIIHVYSFISDIDIASINDFIFMADHEECSKNIVNANDLDEHTVISVRMSYFH